MGERKCKETKCPKGNFVHQCNATFVKCEPCPSNTFTAVDNHMDSCLPCRVCPSISNLMPDVECGADRNRQCKCKPGYYCKNLTEDHCEHCSPVSRCPPGQGVTKNHTDLEDTKCKPCPDGTYNNVTDYISSCKNHTSCAYLGRHLKDPGNPTTDAKCGDFQACRSCNWMLPAGLWAGLAVTALIIFLVLFIIYRRTKRRSQNSVMISEYFSSTSPTFPPDILKCPASCGLEKYQEDQKLTHIAENHSNMDCSTKCDFGTTQVMRVSEKYTTANDCTDRIIFHSIYQSEPQETEWHD
ncbi:tumor necrosis factor receptor superfamily member 5 [Triplophysa rosa]|uniref:Tumor necrosis factor receptor superfamily member 5-like n=1 Tax=Triplophysa rosa TaxID=992332 RepID=A0A9W7WQY8_TRIRA|nr:tumor necrosis factor receptor superfamily member 5 [Triplophysa rosa]XP_057195314.1 tumor necrosis factor receptor superfamily member 5 [Triplophysa rosa]KAI7806762.1 putative tumor necrosis factor receptor superfamily member 5-like [Triplophysa rosa]